jgi:hypothetical protein
MNIGPKEPSDADGKKRLKTVYKSKTGTIKRSEKRKRDLEKAAGNPKQMKLFESFPMSMSSVTTTSTSSILRSILFIYNLH